MATLVVGFTRWRFELLLDSVLHGKVQVLGAMATLVVAMSVGLQEHESLPLWQTLEHAHASAEHGTQNPSRGCGLRNANSSSPLC
jgi:hypothetical protein